MKFNCEEIIGVDSYTLPFPRVRPSWDQHWLNIARTTSERSHDVHTQHGCVIVKDNKIVASGYNGFPRGMDDTSLPTTRPEKYDWMIHAERNAVINRTADLHGSIAYVTGESCFDCLLTLWQAGVERVIRPAGSYGTLKIDESMRRNIARLVTDTEMVLCEV